MEIFLISCIIILLIQTVQPQSIQCRDHDDKPIDWYVMYKLPMQSKKTHNKLVDGGVAYLYMTPGNTAQWTLSNVSINTSESLLGLTLNTLYNSTAESKYYILYNDEPVGKNANQKKGHTKGVVLGNADGGIWIVHSIPKFPPPPEAGAYSYPTSGRNFGQSVFCISVNNDHMNTIGLQLKYNEPDIYAKRLPYVMQMKLNHLNEVINGIPIDTAPWYSTQVLRSLANIQLLSFAKTRAFNKDLYVDYVAPALQAGLLVQTWPNGPGRMHSDCSKPFFVENVQQLDIKLIDLHFSATTDHSKWAVSTNDWVCIGDINRAEHQKVRGGGTVCIQNAELASNYNDTIQVLELCPNIQKLKP